MMEWQEMIMERLDAAYVARFDKDQALIFLNDAYQNLLCLKMMSAGNDCQENQAFMKDFMEIRDLFISQLVDRYPTNYNEMKERIDRFRQVYSDKNSLTNSKL